VEEADGNYEVSYLCDKCQTAIYWQDCPTGGWWIHEVHPKDNHDAESELSVSLEWSE